MTQPEVRDQLGEMPKQMEWVVARDGSLSALNPDGSWWGGCSVPEQAAKRLLKSLEPSTLVSAFLSPNHAGLLKAARTRAGAESALIAIIPDVETAKVILATGDFAGEIADHRLWFVVGQDWADRLHRLLSSRPGLPPPGRFVRTNLTDVASDDAMISAAQSVIGTIATERLLELEQLQSRPPRRSLRVRRLLIIQPARFRLWDDASVELEAAAEKFASEFGGDVERFDSDDPASSSLLALARAAAGCDAVLAANLYRQAVPGIVPDSTPWFTWVTHAPIAPFESASSVDRLSVVDSSIAQLAIAAGWPVDRVTVGDLIKREAAPVQPRRLAIIADHSPVVIPPAIEDLSSHRLLWEHVEAQVQANPFLIGDDPDAYLLDCARCIDINADELDAAAFIDGLIIPSWQRAVVGLLIAAGVPVDLYGAGWSEVPALAAHAAGPLRSRSEFEFACSRATALVHIWPGQDRHAIHHTGRPVISVCESWPRLMSAVKTALSGGGRTPQSGLMRPAVAVSALVGSVATSAR